jgi:hypothetical protein
VGVLHAPEAQGAVVAQQPVVEVGRPRLLVERVLGVAVQPPPRDPVLLDRPCGDQLRQALGERAADDFVTVQVQDPVA